MGFYVKTPASDQGCKEGGEEDYILFLRPKSNWMKVTIHKTL